MSVKDRCMAIKASRDCGSGFRFPRTEQEARDMLVEIHNELHGLDRSLADERIVGSSWGGAMVKKYYLKNQQLVCYEKIKHR